MLNYKLRTLKAAYEHPLHQCAFLYRVQKLLARVRAPSGNFYIYYSLNQCSY
jgi:hypothetical protein